MNAETRKDWVFGVEKTTAPGYGQFAIFFAKWAWRFPIKKRTEREMFHGLSIFNDHGWKWQIGYGPGYWGH